MRQVTTLDQVWVIVTDAAIVFGATNLRIGPSPAFTHEIEATGSNVSELFEYRFMLPGNEGSLELGWRDGRREIDRDTEIAVDLFCEHLADALERVKATGAGRGRASGLDPTAGPDDRYAPSAKEFREPRRFLRHERRAGLRPRLRRDLLSGPPPYV